MLCLSPALRHILHRQVRIKYRPLISFAAMELNSLFKEQPVAIPKALEVKLTPNEDRLCTLLDECTKELAANGEDVKCRIAGGWVRDKLLGAQSHDIDIALENMMGVAFAERLVAFLTSKDIAVRNIYKVERNPEQSKHLETAHTKVLGYEVDFVNLRSEEYTEGSRIPTGMKLGTPREDAFRRDITFNAMFYNVHTRSVEDFTEKGMDDLRDGILRTPLPPKETFMDDPLRIIRCIRFASRYGFKLAPEIEAAADDEIKNAIVNKVSRERIGDELQKMMEGRDPLYAIRLITSLGLHSSIFAIPKPTSSTISSFPTSFTSSLSACTMLHVMLASPSRLQLPDIHPLLLSRFSDDEGLRQRLFIASALTPFRNTTYRTPKGETRPAIEVVIRESLKRGRQNYLSEGVPSLFAAAQLLQNPDSRRFTGPHERSELGLLLRTKSVHSPKSGSHWSSSLLFSLVQELSALWNVDEDKIDVDAAVNVVMAYNKFVAKIDVLGLQDSIDEPPLLNGKEIISILDGQKSGPWLGAVLTKMEAWQLDNPGATHKLCEEWLKSEKEAGRITVGALPDKGEGRSAKKVKTS